MQCFLATYIFLIVIFTAEASQVLNASSPGYRSGSLNPQVLNSTVKKINMRVYYYGMHNETNGLLERILLPMLRMIGNITQVSLFPVLNMTAFANSSRSGQLVCANGADECLLHQVHVCVLKSTLSQPVKFDAISCTVSGFRLGSTSYDYCMQKAGLVPTSVERCVQSSLVDTVMRSNTLRAQQDHVKQLPAFISDGEPLNLTGINTVSRRIEAARKPAKALALMMCGAHYRKNSHVPAECSTMEGMCDYFRLVQLLPPACKNWKPGTKHIETSSPDIVYIVTSVFGLVAVLFLIYAILYYYQRSPLYHKPLKSVFLESANRFFSRCGFRM